MADLHEDLRREHSVALSSNRSFGLVMAGCFAVIAFGPLLRHHPMRPWAAAVSGIFLVLTFTVPRALTPLNKAWAKLGILLGRIVSPVMLGVLYFTVFTPMALILKLAGKDLLHLKRDGRARSYWIEREPPGPSAVSLKNQF
jgi:hypothetical protein